MMELAETEQLERCPLDEQGAEMKAILTRFGEVQYSSANILHFPEGLIGFRDQQAFIVMPNEQKGPLFWIQSVNDPDIAFVLTDPTHFFLTYKVVPDAGERDTLGLLEDEGCHVLTVVTVHEDRKVTLNLQAPILFAPNFNRAIQVVLDKSTFSTREPLPEFPEKEEK